MIEMERRVVEKSDIINIVEDCGDAKKRINLSVLLKFLKITISRTIMNPMCKVKQ